MVRRLAPETRRKMIAEAVLAIAAREGLDGATVRDVAAEAGVSAGMVQHHFRTRDEMLRFACEFMVERTRGRIGELTGSMTEPVSPRMVLGAMFHEMLPLDDERRNGVRVWMAFLARAVVEPELEAFMRETHIGTHAAIVRLLREAETAGELRPGIDIEKAAMGLFATADGLVSHVLLRHYSGDAALGIIDSALDRVFVR
ncbi:MAG TPA: TetR family transcriptional regulator C-terminal domain-containing protein [Thermomicrobiales bacterium]|nr:TetR family transcriptional regulator C-terminal domain-containing protein [Thermomicrobiales bacterium]